MDTGYPALIPDLVPPLKESQPQSAKPDPHHGDQSDPLKVPNPALIPSNPQSN